MGLFGGLFKAVKKVGGFALKTAASKLTGGVSDIVLKKLKGTGQVKAVTAKTGTPTTEQERALVEKALAGPMRTGLSRTGTYENVLTNVGQKGGVAGYGKPGSPKRKAGKAKPSGLTYFDTTAAPGTAAYMKAEQYARERGIPFRGQVYDRGDGGSAWTKAKAQAAPRQPKKTKGTGRTTPQAMKMKNLAAQWRGLGGQAGTGMTFFAWKAGK